MKEQMPGNTLCGDFVGVADAIVPRTEMRSGLSEGTKVLHLIKPAAVDLIQITSFD